MNVAIYDRVCDRQLLALLRFSMGVSAEFGLKPTATEWATLYEEAARHSLLGVIFDGVNRLRGDYRPPLELAMQWASDAESLREVNERFNAEAARLTRLFEGEGHRTAILKGQANALLYPNPSSRQPGDIDIWVSGGQQKVVDMLRRLGMVNDGSDMCYHHIQLEPTGTGIEVEVHFLPSSGHNDQRCNQRLQSFLASELEHQSTMVAEGFRIPSMRYALVMQMAHIRHHLRSEGVGLRQLTDYWLLLRHSNSEERTDVAGRLQELGLLTMGRSLMWVLQEIFGSADGHSDWLLPVAADAKKGRWLLQQVFRTGNFGHHDREQQPTLVRDVARKKLQLWRLAWFEPEFVGAMMRAECDYWWCILRKMPQRISHRSLSLRDHRDAWG